MARSKGRSAGNEDGSVKNAVIKMLTGSAIGAAAFFFLLALAASGILKTGIHRSALPFVAIGVAGISALISGFTGVRPLRKKGVAFGSLSSIPLAIVIILVLMIVNKGSLGLNTLIMIPVMLVFGAAGGVVAANMRRHRR